MLYNIITKKQNLALVGLVTLLLLSVFLSACTEGNSSTKNDEPVTGPIVTSPIESEPTKETDANSIEAETPVQESTLGPSEPSTEASFDYEPGTVEADLSFVEDIDVSVLSNEEKDILLEYSRLRAAQRTDPLNNVTALEASSIHFSDELMSLYAERSRYCLDQLNAIKASFVRVVLTCTVQSVRRVEGEIFIRCKEDYTIQYQYKGRTAIDTMADGNVHTVVMEDGDEHLLIMDYGAIPEALEQEPDIGQKEAYKAYLENHPVTDNAVLDAEKQITEYLAERIENAVNTGSWGMNGFAKEDIPKLLEGIVVSYTPETSENGVLMVVPNDRNYRMPFRQYRSVFALEYEFSFIDSKTGNNVEPFGPKRVRVWFLYEDGTSEYVDELVSE